MELIEHIDKIARIKQRDVLFLEFFNETQGTYDFTIFNNWEVHPARVTITTWLDLNGISWEKCARIADEGMLCAYQGQIYLDVPMDASNPTFIKLTEFLENPDGTCKFAGTKNLYLPLKHALENAHHDEPGFWENWAETF